MGHHRSSMTSTLNSKNQFNESDENAD